MAKQLHGNIAASPERLSKAGQWLKDNPGGWFEIRDVRAVMR